MPDLQARFKQAQLDVNGLAKRPDNITLLRLYALYKQATAGDASSDASADTPPAKPAEKPKPEPRTFPAGSYVVRMDQPYSRIADSLLDYQYWAANDPQKSIYDDTGWTFGELDNVQVSRVTDVKILDSAMDKLAGPVQAPGGVEGQGEIFLINHNADNA